MAVLAVDSDGEVAQAGHDTREMAGMDCGVVLAEGAVPDVVAAGGQVPPPGADRAAVPPQLPYLPRSTDIPPAEGVKPLPGVVSMAGSGRSS
ncbi:hypothetical protein AB0L67_42080, partial [Streptomyces flaveolus]